jgi:prepilin-type processing-associated H-X9-DG protein
VASRLRADFQPQELTAVIAQYDLGAIHRIDRQLKGSRRSPKVLITADRGRFLLKRRAAGRDHPLKVAASHAVQQYLTELEFPLPRLIPVRDGQDTMVILNDLIYEMFEYVTGEPYDGSPSATFDAGRVLALFHRDVATYKSEWEPSHRGYHDANIIRTSLNGIPASIGKDDSVVGKESELLATVSILYDAYESAAERVNDAGYAEWPVQMVHADWHPGNMLFLDGRVEAIIDYDSLRLLPAVTDVANGALQFSIIGGPIDPRQWPAELDEERLDQFLEGYEEIGPPHQIPPEQMRMLPSLMIEALIAEAVTPIAATGSFGRIEGFRFMKMISRKVRWIEQNGERLVAARAV